MKVFFNWLLVVAWCSIIFYLSSTPIKTPISINHIDLAAHAFFYAVLAVFLARALAFKFKARRSKIAFIIILLATAYGTFIEWYQGYVPTRTPSISDIIANLIGAVLGIMAYAVLRPKRSRI